MGASPNSDALYLSPSLSAGLRAARRDGGPVDEVPDVGPVLLGGGLLLLQLLEQPQHVGVGHVEAGLPHVVLDLHISKVFAEQLYGLALRPVRRGVERRPAVQVLGVQGGASLDQ